jgi:hypothetical protein
MRMKWEDDHECLVGKDLEGIDRGPSYYPGMCLERQDNLVKASTLSTFRTLYHSSTSLEITTLPSRPSKYTLIFILKYHLALASFRPTIMIENFVEEIALTRDFTGIFRTASVPMHLLFYILCLCALVTRYATSF